jgi:hypothetical protein
MPKGISKYQNGQRQKTSKPPLMTPRMRRPQK